MEKEKTSTAMDNGLYITGWCIIGTLLLLVLFIKATNIQLSKYLFPCVLHSLTGLYCPGCGGTRAFRALLAGNLLLSIRYHPLVAYMAVVLTAELVSFGVSRAAKNPRYYLGHEKFLVYTGAAIALVNWVYKNYMLVVRGVDLLPLWPR